MSNSQFRSCRTALAFGAVVVFVAGPFFVRMPLTNDTELFDLQTRMMLSGCIPYRDILEPNWPGVLWVHTLVRNVFGQSTEAMRCFDLTAILVTAAMIGALSAWSGVTRRFAAWIGVVLLGFYLSSTEWCHCQRDTWLLLPMAGATCIRMLRLRNSARSPGNAALMAIGEGLLWGGACWLKPYAALVGIAVWIVTLAAYQSFRDAVIDTVLLFVGGGTAAIDGIVWLQKMGAWPYWIDTLRHWNPQYLAAGREQWSWSRFEAMALRMQPWYSLHLVAIPLAGWQIVQFVRRLRSFRIGADGRQAEMSQLGRTTLAAMYLATMLHVLFLQHLFDYVHVPAVILAIVVTGVWIAPSQSSNRWRVAVIMFGAAACWQSPVLQPQRLRLWLACWTRPHSDRLQDRLALFANPNREHLARVAEFLRSQAVRDGDVNIYNSDLVSLYQRLDIRPPTRFVYVFELIMYFPKQRAAIMRALEESQHRFVVTDLFGSGMTLQESMAIGPAGPLGPPPTLRIPKQPSYPWSHTVVFRSGPNLVHEVTRPLGKPSSLPRGDSRERQSTLASN